MNIYNTLTKTKERLIPRLRGAEARYGEAKARHPSADSTDSTSSLQAGSSQASSGLGKIQMFVCGPTVYDYIHIGNARTFVFFDVVAKYLRSQGYEVDYIQNITDIDDKIIKRAQEAGQNPLDWAKEYRQKFEEDMKDLEVSSPRYIPATDHIKQVVGQVKKLIEKKHAYLIENDGYYFDLKTFPEYGKLSGRKSEMADDAVTRIDENDKKRNKGDFCLWKLVKIDKELEIGNSKFEIANGEPAWGSPLGWGRPGWHIEDTAITEHFFGPQYDIHGGGQDLIFPHHEAEITQQESASGKKPFVKYWMHVAFLINKDQKMSKSLGNFETVNELLKKYPKEVLRFYLLSSYYRSPLDYSDMMFKQSRVAISRIAEFVQKLEKINGADNKTADQHIKEAKKKFVEAMDNDFNTPEAFASLFELIRNLNPLIVSNELGKEQVKNLTKLLTEIDEILGVIPEEKQKTPQEVEELVEKREKLRQDKHYAESDEVRSEIEKLGFQIEDTMYGPVINRK